MICKLFIAFISQHLLPPKCPQMPEARRRRWTSFSVKFFLLPHFIFHVSVKGDTRFCSISAWMLLRIAIDFCKFLMDLQFFIFYGSSLYWCLKILEIFEVKPPNEHFIKRKIHVDSAVLAHLFFLLLTDSFLHVHVKIIIN